MARSLTVRAARAALPVGWGVYRVRRQDGTSEEPRLTRSVRASVRRARDHGLIDFQVDHVDIRLLSPGSGRGVTRWTSLKHLERWA